MGIRSNTNVVNIYQTVISTQFLSKTFIVSDVNVKNYDLGAFTEITSVVVLLNGLYQTEGVGESYTVVGTEVVFNSDTILTVGDEIVVYFDGLV